MTYQIPLDMDLIADNFAGGGGASVGIEMALQRPVNIAVNHDRVALGMHHINHPLTTHYCDDVWQVEPRKVTAGRPVKLAWFSPDCKHHSKARGQKPVNKNIRGLAWVALRWAATVKPQIIMLENVEEFQDWGPVVHATDDKGHKRFNPDGSAIMMPCADRKGMTFKSFVRALERQGYKVEWRQLRACDYGAPTIRKRLFLIARCDGQPIVWPAPTHAKNPAKGSGLKPYRTAAECIDWSLPCPSIFDRKKALAENTMKRVAKGMHKFVLTAAEPFIVAGAPSVTPFVTEHANASTQRNFPADEPLRTLCAQVKGGHFAAVAPVLASLYGAKSDNDHRCNSLPEPMPTVTASARHALLVPYLSTYYGNKSPEGDARGCAMDGQIGTQTTENRHALISPVLVGVGGRAGQSAPRGMQDPTATTTAKADTAIMTALLVGAGGSEYAGKPKPVDQPINTVKTDNHSQLAAIYLAQHNSVPGEDVNGGRPADEPFSTLLASGSHQMPCTAFITKMRGDNIGHVPTEGLHTVSAGGTHHALSVPFLTKYYGNETEGHGLPDPIGTVTTKDRFGMITPQVEILDPVQAANLDRARQVAALLRKYGWWDDREFVTVDIKGQTYMVIDIGMRMLTPRELARAQGFPDSYVIDRALILDEVTGVYVEKTLTKSEQVRMIGNSVCPPLAAALAKANVERMALANARARA